MFEDKFEEKIEKMNENRGTLPLIEYEKRVYTPDEIQDILGVSRTTIYQLIKTKVFHSVRVGGQYRISKKSFDKWLEESDGEL